MCTGKCSKCIGVTLIPLAVVCITANVLLFFPSFEVKYVESTNMLTPEILYLGGIIGGGILVLIPGIHIHATGSGGCCANRCGMFLSIFFAGVGAAGSVYCLVTSALGLINGPTCQDSMGNWTRPFSVSSEFEELREDNYLFEPNMWNMCVEPKDVVLFNIILFGLMIGFSMLELILCLIQAINGLFGCLCGTCINRRARPV
ncbi:transmembrane 4 L6 family member 1-like [Pristis pectinata]|uniref:transmembrane 4 L6 family member 1-like n=1 Tax=Pristis pectinata TaxID=685728 RepID=UPI00223DBBFE|nr:transmembrane 4 L6 family member 1-like [Pristis pectinata]